MNKTKYGVQLLLLGKQQKWPTSGPVGYITPAALGVPIASNQGTKSEVAHKWAGWQAC